MNLIASFDQHELGYIAAADAAVNFTRRAARAVLFDEQGRVAIMHFSKTGSYKLPGGGIDDGESVEVALRRELREETGYEVSDLQELGIVEEYRYYTAMKQVSYAFTAVTTHFVGAERTEKERAEGMELQWFDTIEGAIAAIQGSTRKDEDGSVIGLEMMKKREVAILREYLQSTSAARETV